jgi:hypothetical protein
MCFLVPPGRDIGKTENDGAEMEVPCVDTVSNAASATALTGQDARLGNTRGIYCNSNSGGSELQGIAQYLSPLEFYRIELIRSWFC